MENQERYLAQMIDKDGRLRDFYRFSCKKLDTVKKNIEKMASADNMGMMSLFRKDWLMMGVKKCVVFECKNGSYSEKPVMEFEIDF